MVFYGPDIDLLT